MPEHKAMTLEEKMATSKKAFESLDVGDREGYTRVTRSIPMPPFLAKIMKEKMGAKFLINGDWNLVEAEAKFGSD